jgi:hypothetical protein
MKREGKTEQFTESYPKTFCYYVIDPQTKLPTWGGTPVKSADPATFEVLNPYWARDAKRVFTGSVALRGMNPKTLRPLNLAYATDGNVVASFHSLIKDADVKTFRVLDVGATPDYRGSPDAWLVGGFAADASSVWSYLAAAGPAKKLKNVDAATFESLGFTFGRDKDAVFLENFRVKSADPKTFIVLDCGFAKDASRVFYGHKEMVGADVGSFEIVDPTDYIAKDKHGRWQRTERVG